MSTVIAGNDPVLPHDGGNVPVRASHTFITHIQAYVGV